MFHILLFISFTIFANGLKRNSNMQITTSQEGLTSSYPKDSTFKMDLHFLKYNRTNYIHEINITLTDTIDSRYYITFEAQTWGDGGWKKNAVRYENYDPCKQLKFFFGKGMSDLLEMLGLGRKCPFKPGHYYMHDVIPWTDHIPFDIYVGRARFIVNVYKHKRSWF